MLHRVYNISFTDHYLEIELKHVQSSFNKMNACPYWLISRVLKEIEEKQLNQQNIVQKPYEDDKTVYSLIPPYNGLKEEHVINTMRKHMNTKLLKKVKIKT